MIQNHIIYGEKLPAYIIVKGLQNSLFNIRQKDSSIILQSYQLGEKETQHIFTVDVSTIPYVIDDATYGVSAEILTDYAMVFECKIPYALWLYNYGEEYTSITGGWTTYSNTSYMGAVYTLNSIDLTKMNYVGWTYYATAGNGLYYKMFMSYSDSPQTGDIDLGNGTRGIAQVTTVQSTMNEIKINPHKVVSHICIGAATDECYTAGGGKSSDYLEAVARKNSSYTYILKVYRIVFGVTEGVVKEALGV